MSIEISLINVFHNWLKFPIKYSIDQLIYQDKIKITNRYIIKIHNHLPDPLIEKYSESV